MSGSETRRARRTVFQRLVIATNVVAVVGFLFAAGALAYGYQKYGQIPRLAIGETLTSTDGDDAEDEEVVAENYLVVGVDSAAGLDPDDPVAASRTDVPGFRSDTMMVLRVDPASTRAALLSLPRDLWLPIPGHGNGRINEAIELGGPELLVETIQGYLGIPINHYAQIDFYGFGRLVDALDGVELHFPYPVRDGRSGLDVPESGCVRLDARNALGFVRSRAYQEYVDGRWRTDPTGDFGRIRRQQQFIVAALERSVDRGLRNPVTLDELIDSALGAVTIDDTLDGDDLLRLGRRFRSFDPSSLDIYQLPVVDDSVGGAAILRLVTRDAEEILDIFRPGDAAELTEASVRVRVLNGTGAPGQASDAAAALQGVGFATAGTGDATRLGVERTEIRHPSGSAAGADLLRRWLLGDAVLVPDDEVDDVTLVTGADWQGLRDAALPSTSTSAPSSPTTLLPRVTTPSSTSTTVPGSVSGEIPPDVVCG
ncbi:MAG TPA: LCP family protein [Acidimicrobiales bacterium]|nr:LCP family protein [Acidimicrobiales bacterium]